jgi:dolichol-phosphate mannosyltransferase
MSTAMSTVIVIPSYNEAENLPRLVEGLRSACGEIEILLVDDSSPDGTAELARSLSKGDIRVLERTQKRGLASAYVAGMQAALENGATRIVQMDADLSHDPADVPRLLAATSDLVLGSRYIRGGGTRNWPLQRRLLSRFGSIWARRWLDLPYKDLTGGFKAWRKPALEAALATHLSSEGYSFQVEMTLRVHRAGLSIEELPILFTEREDGVSKMSRAIALEAAWLVPMLRWRS